MDEKNEIQAAVADEEIEQGEDFDTELPDDTDWKAETGKYRRSASRYKRQRDEARGELDKLKTPAPDPSKPKPAEPGSLDYGQKAYLAANGIKDADEVAFVREALNDSGKELDTLIGSKWFQAELQEFRDNNAAKAGTPSSTRRGDSAAHDSVEYWLTKGELPPADKADLRRKVVAAKRGLAQKGHFYNS